MWSQDRRRSYTSTKRKRTRSEKTKQKKQTGKKADIHKEADVEVAGEEHRRQEGPQKKKPRNDNRILYTGITKAKLNKEQPHIIYNTRKGQEIHSHLQAAEEVRQPYKQRRTTQTGRRQGQRMRHTAK